MTFKGVRCHDVRNLRKDSAAQNIFWTGCVAPPRARTDHHRRGMADEGTAFAAALNCTSEFRPCKDSTHGSICRRDIRCDDETHEHPPASQEAATTDLGGNSGPLARLDA